MIPTNRIATHPGLILLHEFIEPLGITQKQLSRHLKIPVQRINEIVRGKRGITSQTAWLLSKAMNTTPEFWMNLQTAYDLSSNRITQDILPMVEVV
ncbi:addiction module antidote protein, HigA family [bacterium]|nr:MAG: addiction module antidote protein, HigA family [bacterium]